MKNLFIIFCSIIIFLVFSCESQESNTDYIDIKNVKQIRIDLKGLKPIFSNGQEYWTSPSAFNFVSDIVYYVDDSLFFKKSNLVVGKLIIDSKTKDIKDLNISINYRWTREWYDYSVPKWDPNYHRIDLIENIHKLDGYNIQQNITKSHTYVFTKENLNSNWFIDFSLFYERSLYNQSNKIKEPDSLFLKIELSN